MGAIRICPKSHRVFVQEQEINLKNKEYELLLFLVTNADTVFDRETLYERIWGMDALGDNATVAVHINRLRKSWRKIHPIRNILKRYGVQAIAFMPD